MNAKHTRRKRVQRAATMQKGEGIGENIVAGQYPHDEKMVGAVHPIILSSRLNRVYIE